jgi:hypothetical protein
MLINTPAIYMMANQLALLGLADVPRDARSQDSSQPFFAAPLFQLSAVNGSPPSTSAAAPKSSPSALNVRNDAFALGEARAQAAKGAGKTVPALKLVAFNDTNDLLTWQIPSWYANQGKGDANDRTKVELVNVFVQNDTHWLVLEMPAQAHSNYFVNPEVWKVIACGAKRGELTACTP